ncbi:MAG: endonuclease/exonuclease/phosphatase family protein [Polyangiaceae bacterium]|nr:endonuclease/exonuclease/phosphatase family protein [Polyangiaceae bacterium]
MAVLVTLLSTRPASAVFVPPKKTSVTPSDECVGGFPSSCEKLAVDGVITNLEYVDSASAPLQDFASGNPTGKMWVKQAKAEKLNLALRVYPGSQTCGDLGGCGAWATVILFDARRAKTLNEFASATTVGADDRALVIWHQSFTTFTLSFFRGVAGQNTWVEANSNERWPAEVKVSHKGGWLEIEAEVLLRPHGSSLPSEVLGNKKMGLSVVHLRSDSPASVNTLFFWPGNAGIDQVYQLPNAPNLLVPYTWQTVEFARPEPELLSLMTYNLGLVPLIADGGTGDVPDFAALAATAGGPEIMCFQEVWEHGDRKDLALMSDALWKLQFPGDADSEIQEAGSPQECGGLEDPFCNPGWNLVPGQQATGLDIQDTGLLVLSKRPIFASEVREYSTEQCEGADCLEDKGAIWARVATQKSKVVLTSEDPPETETIYDGDEYVDVFCTHTQASCDTLTAMKPYLLAIPAVLLSPFIILFGYDLADLLTCDDEDIVDIQKHQFYELRKFITEKAKPPDRPAFVLGDFNANAHHAEEGVAHPYGQALDNLGLLNLTAFDGATTIFSKRYDIGLGCKQWGPGFVPPLVINTLCDPILTTEVFSYAASMPTTNPPEPLWARLGIGTHIPDKQYCDQSLYNTLGDPTTGRLDHIMVIPPQPPPGVLPAFAIPNDPEPYVIVDGHPDPSQQGVDAECLSDHKAVIGVVPIVRIEEKLSFNPKMKHDMAHVVQRVENHTGDSAGGAEFFADHYVTDPANVVHKKAHDVYEEDQDVIFPGWSVASTAALTDILGFRLLLWEDDSVGSNDEYDPTPWAGTAARSKFFHTWSLWSLLDKNDVEQKVYCFEDLSAACFNKSLHGTNLVVKSTGTSSATGEYASIELALRATEAP